MKNKHPKQRIARRLLSVEERIANISPFMSRNWMVGRHEVRQRVLVSIDQARARKAIRAKKLAKQKA